MNIAILPPGSNTLTIFASMLDQSEYFYEGLLGKIFTIGQTFLGVKGVIGQASKLNSTTDILQKKFSSIHLFQTDSSKLIFGINPFLL